MGSIPIHFRVCVAASREICRILAEAGGRSRYSRVGEQVEYSKLLSRALTRCSSFIGRRGSEPPCWQALRGRRHKGTPDLLTCAITEVSSKDRRRRREATHEAAFAYIRVWPACPGGSTRRSLLPHLLPHFDSCHRPGVTSRACGRRLGVKHGRAGKSCHPDC